MRKIICFALLSAVLFTSCNKEIEQIAETQNVTTTRAAVTTVDQNPLFNLGTQNSGIYTATQSYPVSGTVTTLDIELQVPTSATLTGVSIIAPQGTIIGGSDSNIVFAEFRNSSDENHVSLSSGQGIAFQLQLNAVNVAANQLKMRVHTTGAQGFETTLSQAVNAGSTIIWDAKSLATTKGNNWITPLNDDVYVSQLSIPGTHDAATYGLTFGKCQELSIQQQWDMGIRVFDLRPGYKRVSTGFFKYTYQLHIYHGIISTKYSFKQAIDCITANLEANPDEFAIVIMRHESDASSDRNRWNSLMCDFLNNSLDAKYRADFRADMTVGDARGKLLILSRDAYANSPICGGFISGWSHSTDGTTSGTISGKSNATLCVQDYYDVSNTSAKFNSICNFFEVAGGNTDPAKWVINHTSGYTGSSLNSGYQKNAANNNPAAYRYIILRSEPAPLGIVVMDYVGARKVSSRTVYGDLLPQTIIDNNYRFTMLSK